ncbi:hypothetical protein [Sporolactobacillus pectinivorans]|uniref:hypothetical protein n=1 Tax=Sporolactobacillus pectinivorans TaxID=1591408 RepID=UPI000C25D3C9|nr:hypothetical protein [Sporolactobacillus pectinivorans]
MKKRFSAFLIIVALLISSLSFSSFVSAAAPKAITYYTVQGTPFFSNKQGTKITRILPVNTKFYLAHKPGRGLYHVTYSNKSGYINVSDLSKSRVATYNDFTGSWILGKVNTHASYQILITKDTISYNYAPMAAVAYVKSKDTVIKNNTLCMRRATLHGDGTGVWGKLTQSMRLIKKNGKTVLIVSKPDNKEIIGFSGTAKRK